MTLYYSDPAAIALNPNSPQFYYFLGSTQQQTDLASAKAGHEKSLAVNPNFKPAKQV